MAPTRTNDSQPAYALFGLSHEALARLLSRSAQGDEEAFAKLYDVTSRRIYGLVLRNSRCPQEAERVAQLIYLRIWREAGAFDARRGGSALCWMIALVAHELAARRNLEMATPAVETALPPSSLTRQQQDILTLVCLGHFSQRQVCQLLQVPRTVVTAALREGLNCVTGQLPAAS